MEFQQNKAVLLSKPLAPLGAHSSVQILETGDLVTVRQHPSEPRAVCTSTGGGPVCDLDERFTPTFGGLVSIYDLKFGELLDAL